MASNRWPESLLVSRPQQIFGEDFESSSYPSPPCPLSRSTLAHTKKTRKLKQGTPSPSVLDRLPRRSTELPLKQQIRNDPKLGHLSTEALFDVLCAEAEQGHTVEVEHIVNVLVKERNEKPSLRLFQALLQTNVDPKSGSAERVEALLADMKRNRIELDSRTYHIVLQVLAVHPDYLLRISVLDAMRQRWYSIHPDGMYNVVAGLIRERQFELALEKMTRLREEGVQLPSWLYDATIYCLFEIEELDTALDIIKERVARGESISPTVWYLLLETGSRCLHHPSTVYAWRKRIELNYLSPSDGILLNTLQTAARAGDTSLAADTFRLLGNRHADFQTYHYDSLIESYAVASDARMAFSVLSIMTAAGRTPTESSTRSILALLRSARHRPAEAHAILLSLHAEGRISPVAAVDVIIAAAVEHGHLDQALDTYRLLQSEVCGPAARPTTITFNALLAGCVTARRKDVAMMLAGEMLALDIAPDALTYDRLISVSLRGGSAASSNTPADDAFRYFDEMRTRGLVPSSATYRQLLGQCSASDHVMASALIDDMRRNGLDVRGIRGPWSLEMQQHAAPRQRRPSLRDGADESTGQQRRGVTLPQRLG
ncbi:MAG: hypothetical protein M1825_000891 [Sarcosagium campestre]|nr:MAG: hypothetical protein M1825_000891 [Sarcosagium campestre]